MGLFTEFESRPCAEPRYNNDYWLRRAGWRLCDELGQREPFAELEHIVDQYELDGWLMRSLSCDEKKYRKIAMGYDLINEQDALLILEQHEDLKSKVPQYISLRDSGKYQIMQTSKMRGVDMESYMEQCGLTKAEQRRIAGDLMIFLDGVKQIVHTEVGRADRIRGPRWNNVLLPTPVTSKDFLQEVVNWYTDNKKIREWAAEKIKNLNDDEQTVLTHLDLTPGNIIIDPETGTFLGLIDWENCGFFPPWFYWLNLAITHKAKDYFHKTLFRKMYPGEIEMITLRSLGRLILALDLHAQRTPIYRDRIELRGVSWEAIQKLVGGLEGLPAPKFDYDKAAHVQGIEPDHPSWERSPALTPKMLPTIMEDFLDIWG